MNTSSVTINGTGSITTSTNTSTIGGYTTISNYQTVPAAVSAFNFANQFFSNRLTSAQVVSVSQQIVSGVNFKFVFQLSNGLQYEVIVYQALDGTSSVTSSTIINMPQYNSSNLKFSPVPSSAQSTI